MPATTGSRFYDAAAWSLANTSPTQAFQTFLYPLDNTPAMDFLLPGGTPGGGGGGAAAAVAAVAAPAATTTSSR